MYRNMMQNLRLVAPRYSNVAVKAQPQRYFASKEVIISAVGSDRSGIVSDVTKYVTDVGGNVGESTASKLGSYFSLCMLVNVPEKEVEALVSQLGKMGDLHASIHIVSEEEKAELAKPVKIGYSGQFTLEGADNPGIVYKVTSILAKNGLTIDKMETSDEIAPHGGTTLFKMVGLAHAYEPLATGFDVEKIKSDLHQLGNELNCDIGMVDTKE